MGLAERGVIECAMGDGVRGGVFREAVKGKQWGGDPLWWSTVICAVG